MEFQEVELRAPQNHGELPLFSSLIKSLFNPLLRDFTALSVATRKRPQELREEVIGTFIAKWKANVGNDIYPAFRLILPEQDSERQMYGLKEKALGKLIIKLLNISSDSPDANSLIQWKRGKMSSAGNFSDRCYEVLEKRDTKEGYGTMNIKQVNDLLDKLSLESTADEQLKILRQFYDKMNAEEMKWLIRIILRSTEKTFFALWHPDAQDLFNVTSSLKRVCWELYSRQYRLPNEPQLAAFKKQNNGKIVSLMPPTGFFMEEKVDGERIQMHMDDYGNILRFYSRKAKDYTYLYGNSFEDTSGSLSKHLRKIISPKVKNCILDGEMVAWDPQDKVIVAFGSLKTAALNEKRDAGLTRPMYVVFDIVLLNDKLLVDYPLSERKKALNRILTSSQGYLEILPYQLANSEEEIDKKLTQVIEESSEGLVIKSPISPYRVSDRLDSWIKVKPDYMEELGENLDLCVIGGYYGQGNRANTIAVFLCGLRVDTNDQSMKFWSFCKVGGGFSANDFAEIRHKTDKKWHKWDPKKIPSEYIEISDVSRKEIPDLWIKPSDSLVFEVKGSQIITSTSFRTNQTLRFPRFKKIRDDKTWEQALSLEGFSRLQAEIIPASRVPSKFDPEIKRTKSVTKIKRPKLLNDHSEEMKNFKNISSSLFVGKTFYIVADVVNPKRISKFEFEKMIKENGGKIVQTFKDRDTIIIADRKLVRVIGIMESAVSDIIKPSWVLDCIKTNSLVPLESIYFYYGRPATLQQAKLYEDEYGDSYTRTTDVLEIAKILKRLNAVSIGHLDFQAVNELKTDLIEIDMRSILGLILPFKIYFDRPSLAQINNLGAPTKINKIIEQDFDLAERYALFCGASIELSIHDLGVAFIIVHPEDSTRLRLLRAVNAVKPVPIRIISIEWIYECWKAKSRLAEDRPQFIVHEK